MSKNSKSRKSEQIIQPQAIVIEHVPASQFVRYPTNRVPTADAIATMAESIRENGVIQHILARPVPREDEGSDLQIIFGETRWRACQTIDENYPVPVRIVTIDDREAAKIHAIENFQRKDLTEIEIARELKHLRDVGWSFEEISQHVGRSYDWCSKRITLLDLPDSGIQAVEEGNISIDAAYRIANLPEDLRDEAVKDCVEPANSVRALPQREALEMLNKKYIEPLRREKEWEEKRDLLTRENPGCVIMDYKSAVAASSVSSQYEIADEQPHYSDLSDAARSGELVVPTWRDLAIKHGQPIYIGMDHQGETTAYVEYQPLIDSERAAHDDNPGDCIFMHAAAVQIERQNIARRRMEEEKSRMEIDQSLLQLSRAVLNAKTTKAGLAKYIRLVLDQGVMGAMPNLPRIFGVEIQPPQEETHEETEDRQIRQEAAVEKAITKMLKAKGADPLNVFARILLADEVLYPRNLQFDLRCAFEAFGFSEKDHAELYKRYQMCILAKPVNHCGDADSDGEEDQP